MGLLMHKELIKKIALENGFKLKEQPNGLIDLNPYVYVFANKLIEHTGLGKQKNFQIGDDVVRTNPADLALYKIIAINEGKTKSYELQSAARRISVPKTGLRKAAQPELKLGKKMDLRLLGSRTPRGKL